MREKRSFIKSLVIIGSGPAAWTAAIYAARSNLKPVVFEGFLSGPVGGQLMTTTTIENFPGFPEGIFGADLMDNMKKQAQKLETEIIQKMLFLLIFQKKLFLYKGQQQKFQLDL